MHGHNLVYRQFFLSFTQPGITLSQHVMGMSGIDMGATTPEIVALAMVIGVFLIGLVFIRQVRRMKTMNMTARP